MNISYIIPVYNAQEYLGRCINSIIKGMGKNEEIILIDDGSTDKSNEICNDFAKKYNFIKTIHQENRGKSCACNVGIDISSGKWLMFIDADDFLDEEYHSCIMDIIDSVYDMILFNYIQEDGASCSVGQERQKSTSKVIQGQEISNLIKNCFEGKADFADINQFNPRSTWGKLFRRDFLKRYSITFFKDVFVGEDRDFVVQCYSKAQRILYVDQIIYHYFFLNNSSISNRYKPNLVENTIASRNAMDSWLKEYPSYISDYNTCILDRLIMHLRDDFFHPDNTMKRTQKKRHIKDVIRRGKYKESLIIAYKSKKIYNYPLEKRIVFWVAVNKMYFVLLLIYRIRYKKI